MHLNERIRYEIRYKVCSYYERGENCDIFVKWNGIVRGKKSIEGYKQLKIKLPTEVKTLSERQPSLSIMASENLLEVGGLRMRPYRKSNGSYDICGIIGGGAVISNIEVYFRCLMPLPIPPPVELIRRLYNYFVSKYISR